MEETVSVTLDFTKCKYISELYREMRTKMHWEEWYGNSLYAIGDILTGMPHYGNDFTILRPYHYTNIPYGNNKEFEKYVDMICTVFREAEQKSDEVKVRIRYVL